MISEFNFIEIQCIYKELMISKNVSKTKIDKLLKVQEPFVNIKSLNIFMKTLEKKLEEGNQASLIQHIKKIVEK